MKQITFIIISMGFFILMSLPLTAAPFSDNGNGTVIDQKSGLVWQKCSMGLNNDESCSGTATTATWINALAYCENLSWGGRTDWRLPNIRELQSITDTTKSSGVPIDPGAFPGTVSSYYVSSTTEADYALGVWGVNYAGGPSLTGKNGSYYVRCVAGP